jgi:hypothetical protein
MAPGDRPIATPVTLAAPSTSPARSSWIRFDRNELAGSFGDIGTDLPLLLAMIPAAGLSPASVFTMFGLMQIGTGLAYGLPMPVQPLKAMAVLVISQKLAPGVLYGAGLAIAAAMLALSLSGALTWLARAIPLCVVRGIQLGLGLSLASLALRNYVPQGGTTGYLLAAAAFLIGVALWGNRRYPAALFIIGLGAAYAVGFRLDLRAVGAGVGLTLPMPAVPSMADVMTGAIVLALPQLPLSLSNSVIATSRTLHDLYPQRRISITRIGVTYAVMNLLCPVFGGVPVCHGCGGLAGHFGFGARTGGSVILYGTFYATIGLLFSGSASQVMAAFPLPVLGVVLLFESLVLMRLVADVANRPRDLTVALLVGILAFALPQGFVIGLVAGTIVVRLTDRFGMSMERHP